MDKLINVTPTGMYTTELFDFAVCSEYVALRNVIAELLTRRDIYDELVRDYKQAKMTVLRDNDAKSLGPNEEARKAVVEGMVEKEYKRMIEGEQRIKNLETEAELRKLSIDELKVRLRVVELSR